MKFQYILLFEGLIIFIISFTTNYAKRKKKREESIAKLIRNAHLGEENKQEIWGTDEVTRDALCCPLTSEQLATIRSCDFIARHDVKVTVYKIEHKKEITSAYMFVTVDFVGFQGKTKHTVTVDHAKVMLSYAFGDPGWYVKEIKQIF